MDIKPIPPFEPIATNQIPRGENWIGQIKWDGVRVLTYFNGSSVKLFNRKMKERTAHYPEITDVKTYCMADSVILDGEIIALGPDGKPSFHEIMRRDGIRRLERVREVKKWVPVTYMIFDVIYYNGRWLDQRPLKERIDILSDIIIPNDHVQLVSLHHDSETLFQVIEEKEMEGIVIKDLNSKYLIGQKSDRWQKKKNYQDLIAVCGGVTLRNDIVNAVLLGLYDHNGDLWYIGHAGTGKLSKEEWRYLTELVKPLMTNEQTFVNRPSRMKEVKWIKPQITVKVQFMNWTRNQSLRQPSIQAFVDVNPRDCVMETKRMLE